MRKTLAIKFLAYHRIKRVLEGDTTAVDSTSALKNANSEFESRLSALDGMSVPGIKATKAGTRLKNETFEAVVGALLPICDGLSLYAKAISDTVLEGQVPLTPSDLKAGNEVTQVKRFWSVLDATKAIKPADLVPYGVEPGQVTALDSLLTKLYGMVGSPRSAIDLRMIKGGRQDAMFQEMDAFLANTLDRAVRNRQPNFQAFVSAYFLARKQHDMPSQHIQEELAALSINTDSAVPTHTELKEALAQVGASQPVMNGVH